MYTSHDPDTRCGHCSYATIQLGDEVHCPTCGAISPPRLADLSDAEAMFVALHHHEGGDNDECVICIVEALTPAVEDLDSSATFRSGLTQAARDDDALSYHDGREDPNEAVMESPDGPAADAVGLWLSGYAAGRMLIERYTDPDTPAIEADAAASMVGHLSESWSIERRRHSDSGHDLGLERNEED